MTPAQRFEIGYKFKKQNSIMGSIFNKKLIFDNLRIENKLLNRLKSESVELLSILAVCLLTDGHLEQRGNTYRLSFSSSDILFVNFICALFYEVGNSTPSIYGPHKNAYNICLSNKELGEKLIVLSPEYKTYASNVKKQPTISFLGCVNRATQVWGMRVAFSADGYISLPRSKKPTLGLACCNENICFEWVDFLKKFGIRAKVIKTSRYPEGVSGIRICEFKSIQKFWNLGGFVDGIKISSKSKIHEGMEKNKLLEECVNIGIKKGIISAPGQI